MSLNRWIALTTVPALLLCCRGSLGSSFASIGQVLVLYLCSAQWARANAGQSVYLSQMTAWQHKHNCLCCFFPWEHPPVYLSGGLLNVSHLYSQVILRLDFSDIQSFDFCSRTFYCLLWHPFDLVWIILDLKFLPFVKWSRNPTAAGWRLTGQLITSLYAKMHK